MVRTKTPYARYLPVNEQARKWELYCIDAGHTRIAPGSRYPPEPARHPRAYADKVNTGRILQEYQAVYIIAGGGWLRNGKESRKEIRAGDLFLLFPGVEHSYSPHTETGWEEYWVGFAGEHARRLQTKALLSPERNVFHPGLDTSLTADFEQILLLCREQLPGFQIILGARILQLLAHIHVTETLPLSPQHETDLVNRAREIMEYRIEEGLSTEALAGELQVNYQYLLKLFRKQTGLTPYEYYLQLRIARARELISRTDLSIKEVSAMLKFDNQYYFSRLFRKKTGLSPSQWRRGIRK